MEGWPKGAWVQEYLRKDFLLFLCHMQSVLFCQSCPNLQYSLGHSHLCMVDIMLKRSIQCEKEIVSRDARTQSNGNQENTHTFRVQRNLKDGFGLSWFESGVSAKSRRPQWQECYTVSYARFRPPKGYQQHQRPFHMASSILAVFCTSSHVI